MPTRDPREELSRKLSKSMARAIRDFAMIEDGDRILCAVSGGKDSYTMHRLLMELRERAPIKFDVVAVNIDQGHPGFPGHLLRDYMAEHAYPFHMEAEDTYSIVIEKIPEGKTFCSLCSRLRRGILYRLRRELGCTKIALGHHRDDVVTTLMLNMMFAGSLKAMPPKLIADDGESVVIRPLVFAAEDDIAAYAELSGFPILPCDLCGSQDGLQRKVVSKMLADLDAAHPGVRESMLAALANVRPSHLLDARLWKQLGLSVASDLDEARATATLPAERLLRGQS